MPDIPRIAPNPDVPAPNDVAQAQKMVDDFARVAAGRRSGASIRISEDLSRVGTPWFFTSRTTDARTTMAFLDSIGRAYGYTAQNAVSAFLGSPDPSRRIAALTAGKVRQAVNIAKGTTFLDGANPQTGRFYFRPVFDAVVDKIINTSGTPKLQLSFDDRIALGDKVKREWEHAFAQLEGDAKGLAMLRKLKDDPMAQLNNGKVLKELAKHSPTLSELGTFLLAGHGNNLHGQPLIKVLDLYTNLRDSGLLYNVMNRFVPHINAGHVPRPSAPNYPLNSPQGVWQLGCPHTPMPNDLSWSNLKQHMTRAVHAEVADILKTLGRSGSQAFPLLIGCTGLSLDTLKEALAAGRPLRLEDFVGTPMGCVKLPDDRQDAEVIVGRDLFRRGAGIKGMKEFEHIPPPTLCVDHRTIMVGPTGGDKLQGADRYKYEHCEPSSVTAAIMKGIKGMCGNAEQALIVSKLCSQSGLLMLGPGGALSAAFGLDMREHSYCNIDLTRGPRASVEVNISTSKDKAMCAKYGYAAYTITVEKDGRWAVTALEATRPTNPVKPHEQV